MFGQLHGAQNNCNGVDTFQSARGARCTTNNKQFALAAIATEAAECYRKRRVRVTLLQRHERSHIGRDRNIHRLKFARRGHALSLVLPCPITWALAPHYQFLLLLLFARTSEPAGYVSCVKASFRQRVEKGTINTTQSVWTVWFKLLIKRVAM